MKQHLEQNLLEIQITDQTGTNFGSSKIDLSKIYGPESDKMWFGLRYMVDTPILKACEGKADQRVGMLKCLFVVETEDCVRCKSCNEYFKETTILKHVTHDKTCGPKFSTNDIQSLKDMAKERKRKRRNQRHKNTYSPTKRAKIHKETYDPAKQKANYDPVKRKEKYDPLKRAELYRQEKKEEEDERKKIYEVARQDHSESMSKETKLENQLRFEETKEQFEMACKWIKDSNITEDVRETLQNVVLEMQKLKRILEDEIDTATETAKKVDFTNLGQGRYLSGGPWNIELMKDRVSKIFNRMGLSLSKSSRNETLKISTKEKVEKCLDLSEIHNKEPKTLRMHLMWLQRKRKNDGIVEEISNRIGRKWKPLEHWTNKIDVLSDKPEV